MFDQVTAEGSHARAGWTFAGSLLLQAVGLTALILLPLLNTYEIDLGAWARTTFRLAAPPPPAPPPPQVAPTSPQTRRRYEADFRAPSAIPEEVAVLHDFGLPVSPIASPQSTHGLTGGLGQPGVEGVLGMFPAEDDDLPLPPPIRVGGNVQNARIVTRVMPVYPPDAIEQHVTGTVKLEAIIGADGAVRNVQLVAGHPMLVSAAMDAVTQWRYRPTRLNGRAVEVVTLIEVNFNLTVIDEKEAKRRRQQAKRQHRAR